MNTLFNLLIFSLPLGVVFRITPAPGIAIYPYDLAAGLIFLFFIFQVIIKKKKIYAKKLFILICAFLLVGFTSLLINSKFLSIQNFIVSLAYLLRYAAYVSVIFAAQFLDNKFRASINTKLIKSGFLFLVLGFIQYFYYPNLRNLYYLGWDEHFYRFFSTFLDPNFAGTFLVLILVLLSENIIRLGKEIKKLFISPIMWGFTLLAIFLTYSRSALLMLLTATLVFLIIRRLYRVTVIVLFIFVISFFVFPNPNIQGLSPLRIASAEARLDSARDALEIIYKNPIMGVGFNAYRYALIRYGLSEEKNTLVSHAGAGTDNSYLFVLATTGILGFAIFLAFWVNIIKIIIPKLKSEFYARVALISIAGLLVNTLFINSFFYPAIMAWIFIIVGFTTLETQKK